MRTFFIFFSLIFFFHISVEAQNTFHWSGDAGNGLWNDATNWEEGAIPGFDDIAMFENVGDITVKLGTMVNFVDSVGELIILENSHIIFESFDINYSRTLGVLTYFELSNNSSVRLLAESIGAVHLWIGGHADVWGTVEIDQESTFGPFFDGSNDPVIFFKEGSIFIAGENLTSITAFNDLFQTVFFEDESTYEHRGGPSPHGGIGGVVSFSQYSNYNIYTTAVSNILFSGKTYGNINYYSTNDMTVSSLATAASVFTFNNFYALDAGISFLGNDYDAIEITGDLINAEGGGINFTCGQKISFSNTNSPVYITGPNEINFAMLGDADFVFVGSGTELILENDISISTLPGSIAYFKVDGHLDCNDFIVNTYDAYISMEAGSLLKTAHEDGVTGCIQNVYLGPMSSVEYYGAYDAQYAGLPDYSYVHEVFVSKEQGSVILNTTLETAFLTLNNGYFDISDQTLRITDAIIYHSGDLHTDPFASRLEFVEVDGSTSAVGLKTPLALYDLSLSITGDINLIEGGDLTVNNSLELYSGRLNIQNSDLYLSESIQINTLTNGNGYIIAENNGFVKKIFSNDSDTDFHLPIGTSNYFSDIIITPTVSTEFYVNCFEHVYANGQSGYQYTEDILDMTWNITTSNSSVNAVIQIFWDPTGNLELTGFDYPNAYISSYDETGRGWDNEAGSSVSVSATTVPFVGVQRNVNQFGLFCVTSSLINNAPRAVSQEFSVYESTPNGTRVGIMIAEDQDEGQSLTFNVREDHLNPDAFDFFAEGTITVKDQALLNHSMNPLFEYTVDVCDDGTPTLCSAFDLTIKVEPVLNEIEISNFLSPNNDSFNDTWKIRGCEIIPTDVFIYDKRGQLIYQEEDYLGTWDGTVSGKKLPEGVYYYYVRTENSEFRGTLTLVR